MSLFKKSNRKFKPKTRIGSDDEEEQQTSIINDDQDKTVDLTLDQDEKREQIKSGLNIKLSFEDEDNEQEFKVKRSSSSLKALKQLERKKKEMKKLSKQTELINQTKSVRKLMETNKSSLEEEKNKSINQPIVHQIGVINLDEIDIDDYEDGNNDYLKFKKPTLKSDPIPDDKTIEMLKRKRFLAKESESSEYISLTENNDYVESSNSRLIREDPSDKEAICIDDDDGEDLDEDRVNFYVDKTNLQKERIKEAFFNAQNEDLNEHEDRLGFKTNKDSDDELDLWEQSQIKKGVSVLQQQKKDSGINDFNNYLLTNQQSNSYEPPAFIKLIKPPLSKDKFLSKYKEELIMVNSKLDYLHNQLNNIELTINNLKETLNEDDDNQ